MATKKKRSCIDCMQLRHQHGVVWCRQYTPGFFSCEEPPIKDRELFRECAKSCEAFDDADL